MESVALKRTAIIAVVCFLLSFVLYRHLRHATEVSPTTATHQNEAPVGQEKKLVRPLTPGEMPWTLEEAMDTYAGTRSNSYVQFVMLQLARNQNRLPEVLDRFPGLRIDPQTQSSRRVDLLNLFAGMNALAESLQLEIMLDGLPDPKGPIATAPRKNTVPPNDPQIHPAPLAELHGPEVKSHAWDQLRSGKRPKVSELSRYVPADGYLVEFRSLTRMFDSFDSIQEWTTHFATQIQQHATDRHLRERIQKQLLLEDSPSQRPFYDHFVEEVALVGSDPYLDEGSDVTLLFRFEHDSFTRGLELAQERLKRSRTDLRQWQGKLLGIPFTACTSPARDISVYVATVKPHLHVRSNSLVGLRRVLEAIAVKDAKNAKTPLSERLGNTSEFQYIRTLLPWRSAEEDGLVYLSDAFLRRLIGPTTRITEARRRIGAQHLRMITYAAQLYRSQFGQAPETLDDLEKSRCAPGRFNAGTLTCPFGGTYTLSDDGMQGVSSVLGTAAFLTPCSELPTPDASAEEVAAYTQFLKDYEASWRTFFDPIAIRLQMNARRMRLETLVLPLQDNSIYQALAQLTGKTAEPLDALPVPPRTGFSVNFRFNREAYAQSNSKSARLQRARIASALQWITAASSPLWLNNLPLATLETPPAIEPLALPTDFMPLPVRGISEEKMQLFLERGIGNQVGLHFYEMPLMFDFHLSRYLGEVARRGLSAPSRLASTDNLAHGLNISPLWISTLVAPVYLSMPVRDARVVDEFLDHLDPILIRASANADEFSRINRAEFYHLQNKFDTRVRALTTQVGPARFRFYGARIGDGLYLANHPGVLEDLHAAYAQQLKSKSSDRGPVGQAMLRIRPEHWKQSLPGYQLGWEENNRAACQRNLSLLSAAARAFSTTPPVSKLAPTEEDRRRLVLEYATKMYGAECICPDNGTYVLESDGKTFRCTVHGTLGQPVQGAAPVRNSSMERLLHDLRDLQANITMTPQGLRLVVVIERK